MQLVSLQQLGKRICIIGRSNSGKSTLAEALSKKLGIPAYHLDQYAHAKGTNWKRLPDTELLETHSKIIMQDTWIIDGNYSVCLNQRLDRATSVIFLNANVFGSLIRYLLRTFKNNPSRPGGLEGAKKEFSFWLIKWMAYNYPKNRKRYRKFLKERPALFVLEITSMRLLNKYYKHWKL